MKRKRKELPMLEKVEIQSVAAEGKAIAKVDNKVIFIPFAAPGDIADIQLTRKKNSYCEGQIVTLHQPSPLRVEPFCPHFGTCGGCKWQHLPYSEQLKFKQQQVTDALERIGKITLPEVSPILGSAKLQFYRNKLEFTFSNKKWLTQEQIQSAGQIEQKNGLGFHIPGMFDKVLDIDFCGLQTDLSNQIRNQIKAYTLAHHYPYFDLRKQEGLVRTLMIRTTSTGELMVLLLFFEDDQELIPPLMQHIETLFPSITSLLYCINPKANDTFQDLQIRLWSGKDHITEEMEGLQFKIGPKSFYQTNSTQAYELYKVVRHFAALTGKELVYDLYTGTGTIAQFVSRQAARVIGIEYVPEAIEDAKANAANNHLTNLEFFAGDMKDILTPSFIETHGQPDVIITDPPRAGMHQDVIETLLKASAQKIVYVSCNPATQARDLQAMDRYYQVTKVQPVDMFPQTHHVENVVLLEKRATPLIYPTDLPND